MTAIQVLENLQDERDALSGALADVKRERDELRVCLKWVMEEISARHPDMLRAYVGERARAILEQTEGWRDYDKSNLCAKCGHYKSICQCERTAPCEKPSK